MINTADRRSLMQEECVLHQVVEFIFTCPLKKFHLLTGKQLALKFNVTLPHLSASFEKKFGVELEKVLIGVKANHGGRMITKNKHTVREISEILDYSDMRCFINMFRQKFGITPAAYRFCSVEIPASKSHVEKRKRERKREQEENVDNT